MITPDHIKAAVALKDFDALEAQMSMSPRPRGIKLAPHQTAPRQAAVLVLVYPHTPDDWRIVLTRRTDNLKKHSGQISFPGGSHDEQDESFVATALRETGEELGLVDVSAVQVIGMLNECYIPPTHFQVHPVVAVMDINVLPLLHPAPDEVAEVLSMPLDDLLRPATRQHEIREMMGYRVSIPCYNVQGHKVWGATAIMLGELEARLRAVVPPDMLAQLQP